jgi:dUTP pyrophosphatase
VSKETKKNVKLGVKKLSEKAILPVYAKEGDSGFDLHSAESGVIDPHGHLAFKTDLAFEIPKGYEIQVRSRSGLGSLGLQAHFGTVDQGFKGNVGVILYNHTKWPYKISPGDRIAQAVLSKVNYATIIEVSSLSTSERGEEGFGSTGIK